MTTMTMLTENQNVPIAGPTGALLDNAADEIIYRVEGIQSGTGNESSASSELASLVMMTYSELHLARRQHYRAVPLK